MSISLSSIIGALEALFARKIRAAPSPDRDGQLFLVRDGYSLEQRHGPRVGQRAHRFSDLRSLAGWLRKHADPELCEILVGGAVVDAGLRPADGLTSEIVSADLTVHPRMLRWLDFVAATSESPCTQAELREFAIAAREDFVAGESSDGARIDMGEYLAGQLQRLAVIERGEVDVRIDDLGNVQFAGESTTRQVTGKLPASFAIRLPWYIDVEVADDDEPALVEYTMDVHLRMQVVSGRPRFALSCPGLDVTQHKARLDAVAFLRRLLGDAWLVGMGVFQLGDVPSASIP